MPASVPKIAHPIKQLHEELDPLLANELDDHSFYSVSVLDFLEHGLGFDAGSVEFWKPKAEEIIKSNIFQSVREKYQFFMQFGDEKSLYKPFVDIANIIIQMANEIDTIEEGNPLGIKFVDFGSYTIKSIYANRKPDVLTLPAFTDLRHPSWLNALVVWEFKKVSSSGGKRKSEYSDISSSDRKRQRAGKDVNSQDRHAVKETSVAVSVEGGSVSSANVNASSVSGVSKASMQSKPTSLKDAKVQLDGYLSEMFSSAAYREWAFGVTVIGDSMTVRYYDRTCTVESRSFKYMDENMQDFVLLILALRNCDFAKFGFSSLFHHIDKRNPSTIQNAYLKPPVPVEQIPDESVERMNWKPDDVIHFGNVVHRGYCVFGRATVVQKVKVGPKEEVDWDNKSSNNGLVIKLSWQVKTRRPEEEIIKKARTINTDNTPAMFLSFTYERSLPSEKLKAFCEEKGEFWEFRCLRIIVFREYRHLYELKGENYKRAFFQIVSCHWQLRDKGGILHRDLSTFNLMYEIRNGFIFGILNDYDLSIIILIEDISSPAASSKHRTGTAPFMAHELLDTRFSIQHLYRHDLESFFYIFIWTCVGYKGRDHPHGKNAPLRRWHLRGWESIWRDKLAFLNSHTYFDDVKAQITADYRELKSITEKLYKLFSSAFRKANDIRENVVESLNLVETEEDTDEKEARIKVAAVAAAQDHLAKTLSWETLMNLFQHELNNTVIPVLLNDTHNEANVCQTEWPELSVTNALSERGIEAN